MSPEFKKAVIAAAVTRLVDGPHSPDGAARYVAEKLGTAVFDEADRLERVHSILSFRESVLAAEKGDAVGEHTAIALYHYDSCLRWVEDENLGPEQSADLLIAALEKSL